MKVCEPRTIAILAGGRSLRFGQPKCLVDFMGEPLIRRVARQLLADSADEELLVCLRSDADPGLTAQIEEALGGLGARFIFDLDGPDGPAAAIEAALTCARSESVFVTACDLPFVTRQAMDIIWEHLAGHVAAIPFHGGFFEPLCAFYTRKFLSSIREYRERAFRRPISTLFAKGEVARVGERCFRELGGPERLFFNVNSQEDLHRALEIARTPSIGGSLP